MSINKINPYIRVAIHSVLPENVYIRRRVIFDYELIYIDKGEFIFMYDDKEYFCNSGCFILICPGVPHAFKGIGKEISQPHIHFDFYYRHNSAEIPVSYKDYPNMNDIERAQISEDVFKGYKEGPFVNFNDKKRFFELFYNILSSPENDNRLYKKSLMIEIINMLINDNFPECLAEEDNARYNITRQIKDFIDSGFGLNMGLDEFEKQFSYSKFYLEKRFKQQFGIGLIAYRNRCRMTEAQRLIKNHTVSETAELVGFNSIYSFSRAYKKHFGKSPSKEKIH